MSVLSHTETSQSSEVLTLSVLYILGGVFLTIASGLVSATLYTPIVNGFLPLVVAILCFVASVVSFEMTTSPRFD